MIRIRTALIILGLLVGFASDRTAFGQASRVHVGYSAISGDQLPGWVAKETGIFQKNGIDAQLIYFTGGTTAVMALVSADTPVSYVAGSAVVNSVLSGSDAVIVAAGVTSLNYYLMGRPGIQAPEQLKGGTVAISRFGSSSDFIARYALSKVGLTPGKDVTIVQIGSTPDRVAAALTGRVQATVINPPASIIAEKKGMTILADLPKLGLVYQHTGMVTTRKYVKANQDVIRRFVKSQVEAVHRIYTDKETSLKVLAKYFGGNVDRDTLEKTWDNLLSEAVLPKKQYPSIEGVKTILASEPKAKNAKPEDFVDLTYIRELDQSGYIDSLYKKK